MIVSPHGIVHLIAGRGSRRYCHSGGATIVIGTCENVILGGHVVLFTQDGRQVGIGAGRGDNTRILIVRRTGTSYISSISIVRYTTRDVGEGTLSKGSIVRDAVVVIHQPVIDKVL